MNSYIRLLNVLLSARDPVDTLHIIGMTTLHHAVNWAGTGGFIKVFLKHKANVNL